MAEDIIKIYVWPDKDWVSEEEIDDLDWYITSVGKSDDYKMYEVSDCLEDEDIDELINLNALPGMLKDPEEEVPMKIEDMGKVPIPEGAVLLVHHADDINYNAVTMLKDRMIVNAPKIVIEVIQSKDKKEK